MPERDGASLGVDVLRLEAQVPGGLDEYDAKASLISDEIESCAVRPPV